MSAIPKIRTKPTLLQRIWRNDSTGAMLVVLWLFAFMALAELFCWLIGAGQVG